MFVACPAVLNRSRDTKDIAVRMVIYGDQEIENWSHRAAARAQGDQDPPTISVPKPIDEEHR